MTEYCRLYFSEDDFNKMNSFIESENSANRFVNIYIDNEDIQNYILDNMKQKYDDNCKFFSEEELEQFEKADKNLGMTPDLFEGNNNNDDDDENEMDNINFHENLVIWENYINYFKEKKIIIFPRIMKNSGIFKILCSQNTLVYTSVIKNQIIDITFRAKIIILNKISFEKIETVLGVKKRAIQTSILSEKEIYDKNNEAIKIFNGELLEKTWHPNRFQDWCLSIDELNDLI
jgi:hypothetical protein